MTCDCEDGTVAPPGMNTLAGLTRTVVDLLLVNVSVTPPEGYSSAFGVRQHLR